MYANISFLYVKRGLQLSHISLRYKVIVHYVRSKVKLVCKNIYTIINMLDWPT